jgi:plasmid maintenance system antidote protein VapI
MSTIQQDFLTQFRPKPTLYKKKLQEPGISIGAVANYVGLTYPYVMNQINGVYPITEQTETKIKRLIDLIKQERNRKEDEL